ncbi:UDP-N-acetylmuramoyl-L-alanine--D-glutamate ligase [Cognatilysobacter lacus]|uniref:UDP-N-acetylmuramoyl-L-alanine--L-glutamate ligase n=1 Tax=Cognatilysobacter lacus TaxID=1643323 RepID=A0A5D8Z0Z9_9GAMM|nr:UDP-N-acetylmuramoyl-L-alanine--D-glutamate ligase [Lysobacter lacus]TZF87743.1 UDP-N-acetylmuramoyl-L-alanine--D-glutamate ligase [Lysobacter lacus]
MRISQLDGRRVALWGWGREGRAAYRAIRGSLGGLPLTLFCSGDEAADAALLEDAALTVSTSVDGAALAAFDIVVKSPGISPYGDAASAARDAGTRFIGGTSLWFSEHAGSDGVVDHAVCVTGTKGKSTTTSLLAHLLRSAGHRTALAGNIGLPLLELLDPEPAPDYWAIELSSYQTGDVAASGARPAVAVVLNLFPEHLDWHGSHQRYVEDKLRLVTEASPRIAVLNAADPILSQLDLPASIDVRWFGDGRGWHLRGDVLHRAGEPVMDTRGLPLPGRHNRGNLAAVLTAIEALGLDARALAPAAFDFSPLPHRLQILGTRDGIDYVNDSISTTPHATLAALECFADRDVALLVGGHDRGLDWFDFAQEMRRNAPRAIITMGANGARIHDLLLPVANAGGWALLQASDLGGAMTRAVEALHAAHARKPVVLMSPGAPSFGVYRDYVERGRDFAQRAGFDPAAISALPGLGVA